MTTIAYKDGIVAFDSRITRGDIVLDNNYNKLLTSKGLKLVCCGALPDCHIALSILSEGLAEEVENSSTGNLEFYGYLIDNSKVYSIYFRGGCVVKLPLKDVNASGSGMEFALGAMEAGASAKEAVKIACKYDIRSGGRVRTTKV